MNKLILPLLFFINSVICFAQISENCEPKEIRTDPNNAFNEEFPAKTNTNGVILNWLDQQYNVNCQFLDPIINTVPSPFYQEDNNAVNHFYNNRDNKPQDGWELIYRKFGYNDNGSLSTNENNPFFVLYNKFTGILRIFTVVGNNKEDYKYARIKLRFFDDTDLLSSLLDFSLSSSNKPLRALDDFPQNLDETNYIFTNTTKFSNNKKKWFYADFPLTYDPCTCLSKSKLTAEVNLIDSAAISLTGLFEGVIADISERQSLDLNSKVDEGKSSISTGLEIGKNAVDTYKNLQGFHDDVEKHIKEFYKNSTTKKDSALTALNIFETLISENSSLQSILNNLPVAGAALSVVDYFVS